MPLKLLPVNYFDEASIAVTPLAFSGFPVTNLQSNVRDAVWRAPNLDQQVISGSWGGNARPVNSWGLWPALGAASLIGARVRVQIFSDSAYVTQVYDSSTLDFFAFSGGGWGSFKWGATKWAVADDDRTARLAPLVRYFTQVTAGSFRITITNGGAVDKPYFEARRFWFAQAVTAPYNARPGAAPAPASSSKHERTPGGVLRRRVGGRWRGIRIETKFSSESDRAAWSDLNYACDPSVEVVLSLFPGEGTRRERDFTYLGSLEVLNPLIFNNSSDHNLQLSMVES